MKDKNCMSDEALVKAIGNGSPEKFVDLYDRYQHKVFNFIQGKVHSSEEAKDLSQETFIKVYKALRGGKFEWRPGIKFISWLYKIAENSLIDQKRKVQRAQNRIKGSDSDFYQRLLYSSISDLPSSPFKKTIMSEFREIIADILKKMPEKYETVLRLRYFGGFSLNEISREMNLPEGKVKPLCYRARISFREHILKKYNSKSNLVGHFRKYNFNEINLDGNRDIFLPMACS